MTLGLRKLVPESSYSITKRFPAGSSVHVNSPGKNTGVGYLALLQGIFQTQRSRPLLFCVLHWQVGSLPLAPPRKPIMVFLFLCKDNHFIRHFCCAHYPIVFARTSPQHLYPSFTCYTDGLVSLEISY